MGDVCEEGGGDGDRYWSRGMVVSLGFGNGLGG